MNIHVKVNVVHTSSNVLELGTTNLSALLVQLFMRLSGTAISHTMSHGAWPTATLKMKSTGGIFFGVQILGTEIRI